MDLVKLTEEIVKSLVVNTEAVSVKEFPTDEDKVIGKNGKCANALRTLVQASSSSSDNKYVKIDIDKF